MVSAKYTDWWIGLKNKPRPWFAYRNTPRWLRIKFQVNGAWRKAEADKLSSDRADFTPKLVRRAKRSLHADKGNYCAGGSKSKKHTWHWTSVHPISYKIRKYRLPNSNNGWFCSFCLAKEMWVRQNQRGKFRIQWDVISNGLHRHLQNIPPKQLLNIHSSQPMELSPKQKLITRWGRNI